ncbi:GTPase Era [Mechercharimyces sp. CAU 1602]|uniref:GTPase Era n=1 Tax=Mechercharimyces sp. CAU 1602 TaxID=2973933 RepID=UPI002161D776|nr:GTPase Era [Mechercharimyces sp. CAU 1602]MCS1350476.1 GTPase Era [Mechercharimyces sp. CAU 1602]
MQVSETYKSGFVALIGRPNVGKSTLMNHFLDEKISIMSDKPQTTRNQIRGVLTSDEGQIIFLDTPGIHKPKSRLGDFMVRTAQDTFNEVDLILFLVDAEEGLGGGDRYIIESLKKVSTPVFLVLNKIDRVHPEKLLPLIDQYRALMEFQEIIPISALQGSNTGSLKELILHLLPTGPQYYPSDQMTDHPEQFIVSELVREKVLRLTHEEIPHSVAVVVDEMSKRKGKDLIFIRCTIFTERKTQKGILIGKQGALLKEVGLQARTEIERLLGSRVFLDLWVKAKKDWRNEVNMLKQFGYRDE